MDNTPNDQNPDKPTERPRVAPPVFTPPKIVSPDTMVTPGSKPADNAHPGVEIWSELTASKPDKAVTSEPDYEEVDDEATEEFVFAAPVAPKAPAPPVATAVPAPPVPAPTPTVAPATPPAPAPVSPVVPASPAIVSPTTEQPAIAPSTVVTPAAKPVTAASPATDPPASEPQAEQQAAATPTPAGRFAKHRKLLIPLAYVVVALISAWLTFTIFKSLYGTRASLATDFVQAVQSDKADVAYDMTSKRFKDMTTKDVFQEYVGQESYILPKTTPSFVSKQSEDVGGTPVTKVVLDIKGEASGNDYSAIIRLVKEDGRWVVYSADIRSGLYSEPLSTSQ